MTIQTNHHSRPLASLVECPARQDFDYITEEDSYAPRLFKYRGQWYDVGEFVRIVPMSSPSPYGFEHRVANDSPLLRWHGIQTDSFFSAILIRLVDDGDSVVPAFYYC